MQEGLISKGVVHIRAFQPIFKPVPSVTCRAMTCSLRSAGAFYQTGSRHPSHQSKDLCIRPNLVSSNTEKIASMRTVSVPRLQGFWPKRRGTPLGGGFLYRERQEKCIRCVTSAVRLQPRYLA